MSNNYNHDYFHNYSSGKGYAAHQNNPTFAKRIQELSSLGKRSGKLLDLGCAWGFFADLAYKKGFKVTGIDISSQAIAKAKKRNSHIIWKVANISEKIPEKSSQFDIVILDNTLEHLPNYHQTLQEVHRILRPNGIVHIHIPVNKRWTVDPTHINYFTVPQLTLVLERLSFTVLKIGEEGGKFRNLLGLLRLIKNKNTHFNYVPQGTGSFISAYAQKT